ncbi:MAG: DNA-3-methyladenine glycosylase I [Anaerolineae bacterium]
MKHQRLFWGQLHGSAQGFRAAFLIGLALAYSNHRREKPAGDSGYFEKLTQAVFQTGFSWKVVRNKWPNFQRAFDDFDIDTVAGYDERDVDRLLADEGIVRNGRKIRGTIENAQVMQQLIAEHGSFHGYLRTLDGLPWKKRRKTLSDAFRYVGPTGVYFLLWSVGEEVPPWEERDQ